MKLIFEVDPQNVDDVNSAIEVLEALLPPLEIPAVRITEPRVVMPAPAPEQPRIVAVDEVNKVITVTEQPLTLDDVKAAVMQLGQTEGQGLPAVRALLDKFGAARVSDVKPEQYAEVFAAARQVVTGNSK